MKTSPNKKSLKNLNTQLSTLQTALKEAQKKDGKDDYISIKEKKDQARFVRVKTKDQKDKAFGQFFLQLDITTKKDTVFIPLSIASGKKPTGFIYHIEGTGEGLISKADVTCKGEGVTKVTMGTLLYAKIPPATKASFKVHISIRGSFGKTYTIVINRINYKLLLTDARYLNYIKEIYSDSVKFS